LKLPRLAVALAAGGLALSPTGGFGFGPSTTTSPLAQIHMVVRGDDGALWHTWYDGTAWQWESIYGLPTSDASIVVSATGQLDVFMRGKDNALWHEWSGNWENLGGRLMSPPCGAPTNPWNYTHCGGNLIYIYAPPADFCSVFPCIPSFWTATTGYVAECNDGAYSHLGGQPAACASDFGEFRPLWAS